MLVLGRKQNEKIKITTSDGVITVSVAKIAGKIVRIGIDAPQTVNILREEIYNVQDSSVRSKS